MKNTKPRAAFYTLGCKVNQNETEAMAAQFMAKGYEIVDFEEYADVYVVNTCTVTHLADRKSRQLIRRCRKINPQAKVVVAGCYAQVSSQEVEAIPGVSLIVGTGGKNRIADLLAELSPHDLGAARVERIDDLSCFEEMEARPLINRARAYLKIQEGCRQFCTYCIIPYARGPLRSRTVENTLGEAKELIAAGFKEIVLTGIHLGLYGREQKDGSGLEKLLPQLLSLDKSVRWRLSSVEPTEISGEILDLLKEYDNFCPHLHLPLQSGHNDILKAMNRPYTTQKYEEIIAMIRAAVPDVAITTDLLVGFPGEMPEHFQAYLSFLEKMAFSRVHVFPYSPRKGTPAAEFPDQVPARVKEARSRKMRRLAHRLEQEYAGRFVGKTLQVLQETEVEKGIWEGHSENYIIVRFFSASQKKGEIIPVKITEVREDFCWGHT